MTTNLPQIQGYTWKKVNPERTDTYDYLWDGIAPDKTASGYGYHLMMNKTGTRGEVQRFPADFDSNDWHVLRLGYSKPPTGEENGRRVMDLIRQAEAIKES